MRHVLPVAVLSALLSFFPTARADEDVPGEPPAQAPPARTAEEEPVGDETPAEPLVEVIAKLKGHHGRLVRALAFSPDGKVLATSGSDRSIRLWYVDGARAKALATVPPSD